MSDLMRAADRREDSNFDRIYKYYYSPEEIQLTDKQKELRERWDHIWKLLGTDFLIDSDIIRKHMEEFKNLGICERTARADLRNAKALFGDPAMMNRMADRQRLNVWIIQGLEEAKAIGDMKAFARLIDQYRKNNLLHLDDQEGIEDLIQHFKPHTFVFTTTDPEILQQEADELMKNVPAVDADYTVVDDED